MTNCMLLFPNLSDKPSGPFSGATLSGPAWAKPLDNMQRRESFFVARSDGTDPTKTQFDVTRDAERQVRVVVLCGTNLSITASVKLTAWYDDGSYSSPAPGFPVYKDAFYAQAFTEDLAWEDENWWDGKPLTEEVFGFTHNVIFILPMGIRAKNWRIEITDPTNPAGFVEIARLFMADGWQPSFNYSYDAELNYETDTQIETAMGGAEFFDRREPYRVHTIAFDYLPEEEALLKGLDLCRRAGIDAEVFWIANPDNERTLLQTSFLGRLRRLSGWRQAVFARANIGFEIKELL